MNKVEPGLGGRGTRMVEKADQPHPPHHFEPDETHIKKADDGSFIIRHEMKLKKRHEKKEGFVGSYPRPMTHTAPNHKEMLAAVAKHFGGKAKAEAESPEEDAAEGGMEEGE